MSDKIDWWKSDHRRVAMGTGALVVLFLLILLNQRMTKRIMRCANKAASEAAARMRAAGEQVDKDSSAGDNTPAKK